MDYGRQVDLEEIAAAVKGARSTAEREYYERIAYQIIRESTEVSTLRHDLIDAVRANDKRAMRMIQSRIHKIKQDQTSGTSWGNNRGNRAVN